MIPVPRQFRLWGAVGAFFAAVFAAVDVLLPQLDPLAFRLGRGAASGAGIYRRRLCVPHLLLSVVRLRARTGASSAGRLGNLVFSATLLLATIWHAEEVNWRFLVAHLWVILYTLEPVSMFFLIPRGAAAKGEPLTTGGPLGTWLRRLLIFEVAALGLFGLFLIISPAWLDLRGRGRSRSSTPGSSPRGWGWAVWAGSMALASDWHEIRRGVQLNILFGAAVCVTLIAFRAQFDFSAHADAVLRGECDPGDGADGLLLLASGASTAQVN